MKGYVVITSDDSKFGEVVGESGDNLIVEHGTLFKSRRPLPRAFAHADDQERIVRTTLSKQILEDAPKVGGDGELDEIEVARHFGLAKGETAPATLGYGSVQPDDPARTADDDRAAAGLPSSEEERLAARKNVSEPSAGTPSPALLGERKPQGGIHPEHE